MDATVIIPTAGRPDLLRVALASIARQSALGRLACVHVSENRGDARSGGVCAEFPSLPIRYTLRDPQLAINDHFTTLFNEVETPYVAMIHDDDWWSPHHLSAGLADLDRNPQAAAHYSAFAEIESENTFPRWTPGLACWFGAGFPSTTTTWELDRAGMSLACLPHTPTRFSALIARSEALKASLGVFRLGNSFDTDRMLAVALAGRGTVLFDPVPDVFIRMHQTQDSKNYDTERTIAHMSGTTRWLFATAAENGIDLGRVLSDRLALCPEPQREALMDLLCMPWCIRVLRETGKLPAPLSRFEDLRLHPPPAPVTWRSFVPPLALEFARKIKARTS